MYHSYLNFPTLPSWVQPLRVFHSSFCSMFLYFLMCTLFLWCSFFPCYCSLRVDVMTLTSNIVQHSLAEILWRFIRTFCLHLWQLRTSQERKKLNDFHNKSGFVFHKFAYVIYLIVIQLGYKFIAVFLSCRFQRESSQQNSLLVSCLRHLN
jgi:hypothetical protein